MMLVSYEGSEKMLIVKSAEELREKGFNFDMSVEMLINEALDRNRIVFLNDKRQLISKNDDTDEESVLAVFG